MKIPNSVRIGGTEYTVEFVENLNNGVNVCYGHIDFELCKIELNSSMNIGHEKACKIFLHEVMHGIVEHFGFKLENEEEIVDMFAKGIYQVLQDNGRRLFDIKDEGKEENAD